MLSKIQVVIMWSLFIFNEHNHPIEEVYDNSVGPSQEIKAIIRRLVQDQPTIFPKQIRIYLNVNSDKLGIEGLQFELHQIQDYIISFWKLDNSINVLFSCNPEC
ncbi:unnamed protein product [Brachionus calyciflorus]|uniref:Uncharacterized protein n=1 Tax=Brachionus calyciflorus TaxID=104777 RepID=A0A814A7D3_9BILA|nr:unnamed protein product [Brachionus calyciflorus]